MLKVQQVSETIAPTPFGFGYPAARSVHIDNYSQSYLHILDAGVWVPPLSTRTIALHVQQPTPTLEWTTPPCVPVPQSGNGSATVTWSDAPAVTTQSTPLVLQQSGAAIVVAYLNHQQLTPNSSVIMISTDPFDSFSVHIFGWSIFVTDIVVNSAAWGTLRGDAGTMVTVYSSFTPTLDGQEYMANIRTLNQPIVLQPGEDLLATCDVGSQVSLFIDATVEYTITP